MDIPIIYSGKCLQYGTQWGHPEGPARVRMAQEFLKEKGYRFIEPQPASEEDILRVHSKGYVEKIKSGDFYDPDTPAYDNIYEYARLAAGGAILAAEEDGFSLMRPPGHHAGINGRALGASTLGFCYFNNIAIAVRRLDKPTLIIDIDGHHGNGTQEIFLGEPKVKFISLHRGGIYPGTGLDSRDNCINIPYWYEPGDASYLEDLKKGLAQVEDFEVVGVSAGFDCYQGDLSSLGLTQRCFREIGRMIGELGRETFGVLEGGYKEHLGSCIHQLLQGLKGT